MLFRHFFLQVCVWEPLAPVTSLHWCHLTSSCLTAPSPVHPCPWFSRPHPATPERLLKVQWKCFSRRNSIMQNGKKLLDKRRQTSVIYFPPPHTHTPFWDVTIKLISTDTSEDSLITKIFSRQNGFKMSQLLVSKYFPAGTCDSSSPAQGVSSLAMLLLNKTNKYIQLLF